MDVSSIEILTESDGESSRFYAPCFWTRENGLLRVSYTDGGDGVTLLVGQRYYAMRREGASPISALFKPDTKTELFVRFGEGSASLPVFTRLYTFCETEEGYAAALVYDIGEGDSARRFSLRVRFALFGS